MSLNGRPFPYMVSIHDLKAEPGTLVFTFVPGGGSRNRDPGELPSRVPQYIALAKTVGDDFTLDWDRSPDDPGEAKNELEFEARRRLKVREEWIARVEDLVSEVNRWARELGWSTREIDKRLDDAEIGKHRVPALLMQEETYRILLEPVGRSSPGTDGLVDLYSMPAYDDIASLYFYQGRWNVHYYFPDSAITGDILKDTPSLPLSIETLRSVLEAMRLHAA